MYEGGGGRQCTEPAADEADGGAADAIGEATARDPCWRFGRDGAQRVVRVWLRKRPPSNPWPFLTVKEESRADAQDKAPQQYRAALLKRLSDEKTAPMRMDGAGGLLELLADIQRSHEELLDCAGCEICNVGDTGPDSPCATLKAPLAKPLLEYFHAHIELDGRKEDTCPENKKPQTAAGEAWLEVVAKVTADVDGKVKALKIAVDNWKAAALGALDGRRVMAAGVAGRAPLTIADVAVEQERLEWVRLDTELGARLGWQYVEKEQLKHVLAESGALMMPRCQDLTNANGLTTPNDRKTCSTHCQWKLLGRRRRHRPLQRQRPVQSDGSRAVVHVLLR